MVFGEANIEVADSSLKLEGARTGCHLSGQFDLPSTDAMWKGFTLGLNTHPCESDN